jgi:murein L,D-transpeptidase YafK
MTEPDFQRSHSEARSYRLRWGSAQPNEMQLLTEEAEQDRKPHAARVLAAFFGVVAIAVTAILWVAREQQSGALPNGTAIDRIVVEKSARKLSVFTKGTPIKIYQIALGRQPVGRKEQEGDMKTPEGLYTIDYRNPQSDFHLALHISYPSSEDAARAAARGVSPGSDIMIHGLPNGGGWRGSLHRHEDWTAGCIALTDAEIEELSRITPDGTPIEIRP